MSLLLRFEVSSVSLITTPVFEPPAAINASTRYCAVFGHPIRHSASPAMQNAGLSALGLDWRYLAFDVDPQNLSEAIQGACRMNFIGLNLTVPHKLIAMEFVDVLDDSARRWGAVNTIRFEGRHGASSWTPLSEWTDPPGEVRAHGFNTDADAITRAVTEDLRLELKGSKVLLLGAGGAGRTAALKLGSEGVSELFLVNRTLSKAEGIAKEIHEQWPSVRVNLGYPSGGVDLVINSTSLGLSSKDVLPFDVSLFSLKQATAVYDMVYRPAETGLLAMARQEGCKVSNGLSMLLYQGAKALELWTGKAAPLEIMRSALKRNVYGE